MQQPFYLISQFQAMATLATSQPPPYTTKPPPYTTKPPTHTTPVATSHHQPAVKQKGQPSYPFFVLGTFFPCILCVYPTKHMYNYLYMCSTDFFSFLGSAFLNHHYHHPFQKQPKRRVQTRRLGFKYVFFFFKYIYIHWPHHRSQLPPHDPTSQRAYR